MVERLAVACLLAAALIVSGLCWLLVFALAMGGGVYLLGLLLTLPLALAITGVTLMAWEMKR